MEVLKLYPSKRVVPLCNHPQTVPNHCYQPFTSTENLESVIDCRRKLENPEGTQQTLFLTYNPRLSDLETTFPAPSHSASAPHKGVFWVPFCSLSTHLTARHPISGTPSWRLQMTPPSLDSSQEGIRPNTEKRSTDWLYSVQSITFNWTPQNKRTHLGLQEGRSRAVPTLHQWGLHGLYKISWVCRSLTICPRRPTPHWQ